MSRPGAGESSGGRSRATGVERALLATVMVESAILAWLLLVRVPEYRQIYDDLRMDLPALTDWVLRQRLAILAGIAACDIALLSMARRGRFARFSIPILFGAVVAFLAGATFVWVALELPFVKPVHHLD